jgi:phosphatidylglycerophosphatase A|tara:strand:- start:245 stop:724 length:480 start_codon:yes stop_codon:yes gene_type:complete
LKPNKLLFKNFSAFLALGFGAGISKKAPGSLGTLMAIPFFLLIQFLPEFLIILFIVTMFFIGIYVSDKTSQALGIEDPSCIVIDEIVGFLLLLALIQNQIKTLPYFILAFILFRIFDIWKPYPIDILEKKFKGGFGIMIDDIGAAIYAYIIFLFIYYAI